MIEFFQKLFDVTDFPPRWNCGNWSEGLGWLHVMSDTAISASYFALPVTLALFIRRRKDVPFTGLFWLFSAAIVACGITHAIEVLIFWHPVYRVSGLMKFAAAIASIVAVLVAIRVMPLAIRLPSLAATNERLRNEIEGRRRIEARLVQAERQALSASKAKSEFLANVSHEIRTPMSAILGYCDVLLGHLHDPDNRNCVMIMKRNGDYLLELINDILDLSRIEAGHVETELVNVALPPLLADLQTLMQVRADENQVRLQTRVRTSVPQIIQTDAIRLRQVLINLLSNAIKFSVGGHVTLELSVREAAGEDEIEFAVIDDGIGISAEQQSRLFKPFSQGDSSVTRTFGGSGLGLAISKRLIDLLGGTVEVESSLGKGSTFFVRLPVCLADSEAWMEPGQAEASLCAAPPTKLPVRLDCRVLVVDDRRDVRHISQHFLEKAGADVKTAEDGLQGFQQAIAARDAGTPFDLIVMDMQMPHMDGLQATAELRAAGIQWPIIALTADAMMGDRERCLQGGCDDYLSKPIDHAALVEMVAQYTQTDLLYLTQKRKQRTSRGSHSATGRVSTRMRDSHR